MKTTSKKIKKWRRPQKNKKWRQPQQKIKNRKKIKNEDNLNEKSKMKDELKKWRRPQKKNEDDLKKNKKNWLWHNSKLILFKGLPVNSPGLLSLIKKMDSQPLFQDTAYLFRNSHINVRIPLNKEECEERGIPVIDKPWLGARVINKLNHDNCYVLEVLGHDGKVVSTTVVNLEPNAAWMIKLDVIHQEGARSLHMGEFPEPQRKSAAARENWDIGPSQEGPIMIAINSSQIFLENPDI